MTDLSKFTVAKSDQLNADDLRDKDPITITITKVSESSSESAVDINYEGDYGKPWRPCKSMIRVLCEVWGKQATAYYGRSVTLFCDKTVMFGKLQVGGIRISHMSHINGVQVIPLATTRGAKKAYTVHPLITKKPAASTSAAMPAGTDDEAIKTSLRKEAEKGTVALKTAWVPLGGPTHQRLGVAFLDELKATAAKADAAHSAPIELPEPENSGNSDQVDFDQQ